MTDAERPPIALTIAGSDSGGGAGIQADLKTFHAFRVFGTSAITAVTAQNTTAVTAIHPVPTDVVHAQIEAVAEDLPPDAAKTGMLASVPLVRTVAAAVRALSIPNLVMDPVMVASSGARLLDADAEHAIREVLMPLAALVTPNLHEARILTGLPILDEDGMEEAARALVRDGAAAALVKGGHLEGSEVVDVLFDGTRTVRFRNALLPGKNTHGTGCTLSAAIAAGLAWGFPLEDAVERGIDFVHRAIRMAPGLGQGHGPVNHLIEAPLGRG